MTLELIGGLVAIVGFVFAVPALGAGVVLLEVTPLALLIAVPVGVAGAALVEIAVRVTTADRWNASAAGRR